MQEQPPTIKITQDSPTPLSGEQSLAAHWLRNELGAYNRRTGFNYNELHLTGTGKPNETAEDDPFTLIKGPGRMAFVANIHTAVGAMHHGLKMDFIIGHEAGHGLSKLEWLKDALTPPFTADAFEPMLTKLKQAGLENAPPERWFQLAAANDPLLDEIKLITPQPPAHDAVALDTKAETAMKNQSAMLPSQLRRLRQTVAKAVELEADTHAMKTSTPEVAEATFRFLRKRNAQQIGETSAERLMAVNTHPEHPGDYKRLALVRRRGSPNTAER